MVLYLLLMYFKTEFLIPLHVIKAHQSHSADASYEFLLVLSF